MIDGAIDAVVALAVVFTGAAQGRIDLIATVDAQVKACVALHTAFARAASGSRPERALHAPRPARERQSSEDEAECDGERNEAAAVQRPLF